MKVTCVLRCQLSGFRVVPSSGDLEPVEVHSESPRKSWKVRYLNNSQHIAAILSHVSDLVEICWMLGDLGDLGTMWNHVNQMDRSQNATGWDCTAGNSCSPTRGFLMGGPSVLISKNWLWGSAPWFQRSRRLDYWCKGKGTIVERHWDIECNNSLQSLADILQTFANISFIWIAHDIFIICVYIIYYTYSIYFIILSKVLYGYLYIHSYIYIYYVYI